MHSAPSPCGEVLSVTVFLILLQLSQRMELRVQRQYVTDTGKGLIPGKLTGSMDGESEVQEN